MIWSNTQFDIKAVYKAHRDLDNFKIETSPSGINICAIYFSGHGIYYPTTETNFINNILKKDNYEWYNTRITSARKHIFLRDVFKQWYINGINSSYDSHISLLNFLMKETDGFEVITVGSSAGGYAATLYGCLLQASHVFTFSGQFTLDGMLENDEARRQNQLLARFEHDPERNKYFNLSTSLAGYSTPIFYYLPVYSQEDIDQYNIVKHQKNIFPFFIKSDAHGVPIYKSTLHDILQLTRKEIFAHYAESKERHTSPLIFSLRVSGVYKTFFTNSLGKLLLEIHSLKLNLLNYLRNKWTTWIV